MLFRGNAICNISRDVVDVCNTLPPPADGNSIAIVKLRKLQHRDHVYFESLGPNFEIIATIKIK